MAGGLLLDADGRAQALNHVDVGLVHQLQELPGIGAQAFDIAALALRRTACRRRANSCPEPDRTVTTRPVARGQGRCSSGCASGRESAKSYQTEYLRVRSAQRRFLRGPGSLHAPAGSGAVGHANATTGSLLVVSAAACPGLAPRQGAGCRRAGRPSWWSSPGQRLLTQQPSRCSPQANFTSRSSSARPCCGVAVPPRPLCVPISSGCARPRSAVRRAARLAMALVARQLRGEVPSASALAAGRADAGAAGRGRLGEALPSAGWSTRGAMSDAVVPWPR